MPIQGALTGAEHIRTAAAANLANQIATMSCAADDLLERHTVADESRNCGMAVLAPQITLITQHFRVGQQFRIDRRRSDCGSDAAHGAAHRIKEGRARVFHQMPAVGDLDGVRERLAAASPYPPPRSRDTMLIAGCFDSHA